MHPTRCRDELSADGGQCRRAIEWSGSSARFGVAPDQRTCESSIVGDWESLEPSALLGALEAEFGLTILEQDTATHLTVGPARRSIEDGI
jgi:hypothetical protein